jgi:recombination protein RecR
MPRPWKNLVGALSRLPGVGPKMAERLALHLLRHPPEADELLACFQAARDRLGHCPDCGDFVEKKGDQTAVCERCRDPLRSTGVLCVVEEVGDLQALERSRAFQGRYHVLGGVLSPLDGVGPEDLRIEPLLKRVNKETIKEVILATNPTAEGETTAAYLADLLKTRSVSVTRLAYGLPTGSVIQYADEFTLAKALEGRRAF